MKLIYDAVIVANGQYPSHKIPLNILHRAKHLIACDGAIASLLLEGLWEALLQFFALLNGCGLVGVNQVVEQTIDILGIRSHTTL